MQLKTIAAFPQHPTASPSRRSGARLIPAVACVVAALTAFPAMAQPQNLPQPVPIATGNGSATPASALPVTKTQGKLRYTCGGISVDESSAMRAAMKDHPLSLLFAAAGGAYLADVEVKLVPQGWGDAESLTFTASGPVCLLDLPAGSYEIEVRSGDKEKRQTVMVGKDPKTVDFRF
ncbi:hypothetical protein [Paracidovorax konjaci]|uniref:Carboxypeptidase regulatory-like domain-containing protein n=1 Tax=Paracidovorax konjaci TaxID=32040 RepID=A0A1I1WAI9_9BURK|nr:hypothetical protein [Paracidovorax konjaci]SFD92215.1 hypothetical protein SAMN04489710_1094 [Paracidovorax konjaci]